MPHDVTTILELGLLLLSLGFDTLTVAVALGISGIGGRQRLRVGTSFALFEGSMPLVGFAAGRVAGGGLGTLASDLGIVILLGVGAWMVYESLSDEEERRIEVGNWWALILTSISVSLDELAIGFSMGALGLPIGLSVGLIAAQAFTVTMIGTAMGNRIGAPLAGRAAMVAGIILCGLAVLLVVERIAGAKL